MPKGNTYAVDLVEKIFQNVTLPFDAATELYLSLHTANPGAAGSQTTSEATYTGYSRMPIGRSTSAWNIAGQLVRNTSAVVFPTNTGANQTVSYVGIGTAASGAGQLLYHGALAAATSITTGTAPIFQPSALTVQEQ